MLTLNNRYIRAYHERDGADWENYADLIVGIVAAVGFLFLILIGV